MEIQILNYIAALFPCAGTIIAVAVLAIKVIGMVRSLVAEAKGNNQKNIESAVEELKAAMARVEKHCTNSAEIDELRSLCHQTEESVARIEEDLRSASITYK